ncbi:unnamed protein product [Ceratitis capitata]|uniref:(Mediterranean fruit fly) hypothetical protein n=1 Tax=Ceratitis capitata TaxID=7213 RepID=A0A811U3S1_CERCA|nr:unnamed protein product [Ceratitis capitata]
MAVCVIAAGQLGTHSVLLYLRRYQSHCFLHSFLPSCCKRVKESFYRSPLICVQHPLNANTTSRATYQTCGPNWSAHLVNYLIVTPYWAFLFSIGRSCCDHKLTAFICLDFKEVKQFSLDTHAATYSLLASLRSSLLIIVVISNAVVCGKQVGSGINGYTLIKTASMVCVY